MVWSDLRDPSRSILAVVPQTQAVRDTERTEIPSHDSFTEDPLNPESGPLLTVEQN